MSSEHKSYSRIMKSSALIGGAQGVKMFVGIIRVKFAAVLIGPLGIGLVSTYQAVLRFLENLFGLGLKSSAVREIAEANGAGEQKRLARSIITVRRLSLLTGIGGASLISLFSSHLSLLTFNDVEHAFDISLVGLALLFMNIRGGQIAAIQGMRRIGDLARLRVLGVTLGSIISIILYFLYGLKGVVPALVSLSFVQLVVSWWYARKIEIEHLDMSWLESVQFSGGMIKLGFAFMWGALLTTGVAYGTRMIIARDIDMVAVGIFAAAYSMSDMVVNFILQAMGADYYPSLTAVSSDHAKMRQLVNQQTEIGILLALPGLLATLALAPWVIQLFYSSEFWQAADLLRWFAMGCIIRVVSWPMGFVILAKGLTKLFAFTQTLFNGLHILAIWGFLALLGIEGTAIAFFVLYLFHVCLQLFISSRLINFKWSVGVQKLLGMMGAVVLLIFLMGEFCSEIIAMSIGSLICIGISIFCFRELLIRLGPSHRIHKSLMKMPYIRRLFLIDVHRV